MKFERYMQQIGTDTETIPRYGHVGGATRKGTHEPKAHGEWRYQEYYIKINQRWSDITVMRIRGINPEIDTGRERW